MRYALFFAPPPTSLLWKKGCQWLGRDAVSGALELQPLFRGLDAETIREVTRTPARYGFHATMVAPFRLKDDLQESQLLDALSEFTADKPPLTIPPLTVSQLDHFFCLRPIRHCVPLQGLASLCTRAFDRFRAPLNPSELARRKAAPLNGQEKKNLEWWGYPYVFEQFRFHFTLTARIAEGKCKDRIHVVLLETFEPLLNDPLVIDALCLFVEPAPGQPLRCLHRFPFASPAPATEERVAHDQQFPIQNLYPRYQCHSS
jgi:putative phosphonate metabolism protein